MSIDLDKSGNSFHRARTYLGPSLGWADIQVNAERLIQGPGTFDIGPGEQMIFLTSVGPLFINLPNVVRWVNEFAYQPATGFERVLKLKEVSGLAQQYPITITPFGTQTIDNIVPPFQIISNQVMVKLYPRNDLLGWFSEW